MISNYVYSNVIIFFKLEIVRRLCIFCYFGKEWIIKGIGIYRNCKLFLVFLIFIIVEMKENFVWVILFNYFFFGVELVLLFYWNFL